MPGYLALLAPSGNRVYAGDAPAIAAAELSVLAAQTGVVLSGEPSPVSVAGVTYLGVELEGDAADGSDGADADRLVALVARLAGVHALFGREGELLRPVLLPATTCLDDDLLTIPKYPGKTNEQLTHTLLTLTLAATAWPEAAVLGQRPFRVLDPLAGRGTTLSWALALGHDAIGVEAERREVEAYDAFLRTWLRRKRIRHTISLKPLRRNGVRVADVLEAELRDVARPPDALAAQSLSLTVYAADTLATADLLGKRKVDVVVTDAPYGVVHGSRSATGRDRSPAGLLGEAVPVWASVLRAGGAMGIAWNTHGLRRDELAVICEGAGLRVRDDPAFLRFGHRVDAGIHRDLLVATKPG